MKKSLKLFLKQFLFISILFSLISCSNIFPPYDVEFINNSSHTVEVRDVHDADNPNFILNLNQSKTISIDSYEIQFQYLPANLVNADIDTSENKVIFTNR